MYKRQIYIKDNGRVAIGSTTTNDLLHVSGTSGNGTRIRVQHPDNGYSGYIAKNSEREWFIGAQGTGDPVPGEFHIYDNNVSAQRMAIDADGNVGIGRGNPQNKLYVNGAIRMTDGNQQVGYIPVSDATGKMTWTDPGTISTADDGDADPANEFQNLSSTTSGTNRTINISSGTGTTISVADNDNSASNEIQNLSSATSGTNRTINISGGTGTTINVADNDNSTSNEIQDLSLSGNTLSLTGDGSTVNLSGYLDNTDDQTLSFSDPNLSISDGNSVNLSALIDDEDWVVTLSLIHF